MKWKFNLLFWVCYIGLEENFPLCVCVCVCVCEGERERGEKREFHYTSSSQTYLEFYNITLSLYKPGQALMFPGGWNSLDFSTVGTGSCQVVSPTHRSRSPPKVYSCHSLLLEAESTPGVSVRPEGFSQWKSQIPSGIEPATFRCRPPRIL